MIHSIVLSMEAIPLYLFLVLFCLRGDRTIGYGKPSLETFMFMIAIIDDYSRFIVYHELRVSMEKKDMELVEQRASDSFRSRRPRIISDRGTQFIARDLRDAGLSHTFTSVGYSQSNGKIEGFFITVKSHLARVVPQQGSCQDPPSLHRFRELYSYPLSSKTFEILRFANRPIHAR